MISFKYINQNICFVDCEQSYAMELNDLLSFEVPNAKFSPKYKCGMWDGRIHLFRRPYLPLGLAPRAISFLKRSGYSVDVDPRVIESFLDHFYDRDGLDSWIESCDLRNELGDSITPFEHQIEAVHFMLKHKRMILVSPTNSGKSLIIFLVSLKRLLDSNKKVLIIVPNVNLVGQMYRDINSYSNGILGTGEIQQIYAGRDRTKSAKIVISTWQSIYKESSDWFDDFDTVICDEGHLATAKSINGIMEKCNSTTHRYALTGTLTGQKCHNLVIESNFGPVKKFVTTKELIEAGVSAQLDIKSIIFNYDDSITSSFKKRTSYDDEQKFIMRLPERNRAITNFVSRLSGNVIVLFNNVEHGEILLEAANQNMKKRFFYLSGRNSVSERQEIIDLMNREDNIVTFATYGIFSVGISIKNIDHLVFASSTKSIIRVLQSVGRVLRVSARKKKATVWDLVDNLSTNGYINYSVRHYIERQKIFETEQFPVTSIEVPINR